MWVRANGESLARSVPMLSKRAVVQDMRDKMDIVKKHYETVVSSRPALCRLADSHRADNPDDTF